MAENGEPANRASSAVTLASLQSLSDSRFHQLCDELLPALEDRFALLTPHGINPRGQSIKGHPDSYVGNSAATCKIAFEYTAQKSGWQAKVLADVQEVKRCCPEVEETVIALSLDIDRGLSKNDDDWETQAAARAAPAVLTIFSGRRIAHLLDTQHQHLRLRYLGIPCSRLSAESILAGCQKWNDAAIARLRDHGRYLSDRYAERESDLLLYRVWQLATDAQRPFDPALMIPIVGDSGIGKTSITARLIESINAICPALFLQARDIAFDREDALVRKVLASVQGVVADEHRRIEEAAIAAVLCGDRKFTVILDGLDEANNPEGVRQAISYWIASQVGERSAIIVTSRPEFWQRCQDISWRRHFVFPDDLPIKSELAQPISASIADRSHRRFALHMLTDFEAAHAWELAGRSRDEFHALPLAIQSELRHPFTLFAASELAKSGVEPSLLAARTEIMERWIDARLKAQSEKPGARVSPTMLREALSKFARIIDETGRPWQRIDQLGALPGFNVSSPPGYVVEHLLDANLLERRDQFGTEIRFTLEAVQDFFAADHQIALIEADPLASANALADLTFTEAETRLERIGNRLSVSTARDRFIEHLLDRDPWKVAVVLRGAIGNYGTQIGASVAESLGKELSSAFICRRAKAAELLGQLGIPEARRVFAERIPKFADCDELLKSSIALASVRLSVKEGIEHLFECRWFRDAVFFTDVRAYLALATAELRSALADYAFARLNLNRGSKDHLRTVTVLGYLRDERLLANLEDHVRNVDRIKWYEINAVLNFDCRRSAAIYEHLFRAAVAEYVAQQGRPNQTLDDYWIGITGMELRGTVRRLNPHVEQFILRQLQVDDPVTVLIAGVVAKHFPTRELVEAAIPVIRSDGLIRGDFGRAVGHIFDFDSWKPLWERFRDAKSKRHLIAMTPRLRDPRVEALLLASINDQDIATDVIYALGDAQCIRAAPYLRRLIATNAHSMNDSHNPLLDAAVTVLGRFRDPAAVEVLRPLALSEKGLTAHNAVESLAHIRTEESGGILRTLAKQPFDEDNTSDLRLGWLVGALICHGSTECVELAVQIAVSRPNSERWLMERVSRSLVFREWSRWRYYSYIDTAPLVRFIRDGFNRMKSAEQGEIIQDFSHFDSLVIREFLRDVANEHFTSHDQSPNRQVVSHKARLLLAERGDSTAIPVAVNQILEAQFFARRYSDAELQNFDPESLTKELLYRLDAEVSVEHKFKLLHLVGEFGAASDASLINRFENDPEPRIANAACESATRLADPQLLPDDWL